MPEKVYVNGRSFDALLTTKEVADAFGVTPTQVGRWARDGRFPDGSISVTPGGHRRYDAATIAALVAEGTS
jgi:DNA-binding transcriptional MerR regulator